MIRVRADRRRVSMMLIDYVYYIYTFVRSPRGGAMKATVVDLRYNTRDILRALDRRETVSITYHGKVKGVIHPTGGRNATKASEHAFFGMYQDDTRPVESVVQDLRGGRYRDL